MAGTKPGSRDRARQSGQGDVAKQGSRLSTFTYEGGTFLVFSSPLIPLDLESLTPSEKHVLANVARGMSNAAIARARKTSVRTVANQVASLLRKTGAGSRTELARLAVPAASAG